MAQRACWEWKRGGGGMEERWGGRGGGIRRGRRQVGWWDAGKEI